MSAFLPHPSTLLIRNARLIDPLLGTDAIGDLHDSRWPNRSGL